MSNLFDKLLIVLLLTLLPVGLWFSYSWAKSADEKSSGGVAGATDTQKIESLIAQINAQKTAPRPETTPLPFSITDVSQASESNTIKIRAKAPANDLAVLVSATVLPVEDKTASGSAKKDDLVKGSKVDTWSIAPENDKTFEVSVELDKKQKDGIIELRLEQDRSINTVRFDIAKKAQIK
jgi:hypothetical protein